MEIYEAYKKFCGIEEDECPGIIVVDTLENIKKLKEARKIVVLTRKIREIAEAK